MSKSYKKKREQEENTSLDYTLSKKELYDLEKAKKNKIKDKKKKNTNKKVSNKIKNTNLGSRIFAIFMLLLMVGSVIISSLAYVLG